METSTIMLTPKHSFPHCKIIGEWADSKGKPTDLNIWTVVVDPGPYVYLCVCCTHHICILQNRARGRHSGSAYCSASLRAAEYDHHECQTLKTLFKIVEAPLKKKITLINVLYDDIQIIQEYKSFDVYAVTIKISMTSIMHHWMNGQAYHLL